MCIFIFLISFFFLTWLGVIIINRHIFNLAVRGKDTSDHRQPKICSWRTTQSSCSSFSTITVYHIIIISSLAPREIETPMSGKRKSNSRRRTLPFNVHKKRRKILTDEQERLLYEVWKHCFLQKEQVCSLTSLLCEQKIGFDVVLRLERLVGDVIFAWLFPGRTKTGLQNPPQISKRSLEQRMLWVQEIESLAWKVVQPFSHDLMDQWSRQQIQLFFYHLINLY